jgi:hypothetical protein
LSFPRINHPAIAMTSLDANFGAFTKHLEESIGNLESSFPATGGVAPGLSLLLSHIKNSGIELTPQQRGFLGKVINNEVPLVPPAIYQQMADLFQRLDRDNSGTITAADFTADEADIWQNVQRFFDYSKDGVVEAQEFVAGFIADAWKENPLDENYLTDTNYPAFNQHLLGMIGNLASTVPEDEMDAGL